MLRNLDPTCGSRNAHNPVVLGYFDRHNIDNSESVQSNPGLADAVALCMLTLQIVTFGSRSYFKLDGAEFYAAQGDRRIARHRCRSSRAWLMVPRHLCRTRVDSVKLRLVCRAGGLLFAGGTLKVAGRTSPECRPVDEHCVLGG